MKIIQFNKQNKQHILDVENLLMQCFPNCYSENSNEQVEKILSEGRIAFVAIDNNEVVGLIGAMPQYGVTGWELHPLAVSEKHRKQGVATSLVEVLEREIVKRGGVTIYLGCDDEFESTSLYGVDLYDNLYHKIENIININNHPFEFYQKMGYKIVGVIPDANGIGKPDIFMAKRIL